MKSELLADKKLFLMDMDGTIYLDETLFPGTQDFLSRVRARGGRALFVTNNSSKSVDAYVEKLCRIGIPATPQDFVTSTDATVDYVRKHHPDTLFYAMGTHSFVRQLRAGGVRVVTRYTPRASGVITSNDTELTFRKLSDVSRILTERADAVYLATNPDPACPASFGFVPDCGSFSVGFHNATGRDPVFLGKPQPQMLFSAMERTGFSAEQTVMVGDMLHTDIEAGNNAGVCSVLLFSGGTTRAMYENSAIRATCTFENIRELADAL